MQTHQLKRKTKNKKAYKVGRGGKHAKTAGRGTKGQNARAGRKKRPELRDFIKRFPKLRGRGKNSNLSIEAKPTVVSLTKIDKHFAANETVSPTALLAKGLIAMTRGTMPKIKILGGKSTKKFVFENVTLSKSVANSVAGK